MVVQIGAEVGVHGVLDGVAPAQEPCLLARMVAAIVALKLAPVGDDQHGTVTAVFVEPAIPSGCHIAVDVQWSRTVLIWHGASLFLRALHTFF